MVTGLAGDDDTLLVAGADAGGAPVAFAYGDGTWSELFRADARVLVGAGGGVQVVVVDAEGWRRATGGRVSARTTR
ncbi:MAG: hypothetical protein ACOZNI_12670 [Myxococcota bacterium]